MLQEPSSQSHTHWRGPGVSWFLYVCFLDDWKWQLDKVSDTYNYPHTRGKSWNNACTLLWLLAQEVHGNQEVQFRELFLVVCLRTYSMSSMSSHCQLVILERCKICLNNDTINWTFFNLQNKIYTDKERYQTSRWVKLFVNYSEIT